MWWKKTSFLVFLTVFLACSWFFSTGGWNQISRIDAIMSFVEFPVEKRANPDFLSFRINHFVPSPDKGYNTGDWSFYNGNYYSNKAPGALFLGILTYAPLHCLEYLVFGFLDDIFTDVINLYIVNLVQSALPAALAAWILFHILQMLGTGKNASAFWALAYGLGTPVFCYSSMLWGYGLAACCFMFAIYFYLKNSHKEMIFCGLFTGYAVLSDYLCGVLVPAFAVMIFLRAYLENCGGKKERFVKSIKSLSCFALGGIPMFLLYAMYHKICFNSFFAPATVFNNPLFHDKEMIGGTFGSFRPFIILKLLFSQHRGLLFYSPVLLGCFSGFLNMIRDKREKKILAWGLVFIILASLFIVATFNGWHGGHSFSARYLIPVIPALAVLCGAFPLKNVFWRIVAAGTFLLSFFYMLIVTYLNPLINDTTQNPFWGWAVDTLKHTCKTLPPPGLIRMYGMIENMKEEASSYSSFSLGELIGLSGYGSMILLTLLLVLLVCGIYRDEIKKIRLFAEKIKEISSYNITVTFSWILLFIVLLLLFAVPGMIPWIKNEPALLAITLRNNDQLIFADRGLTGSVGFFYGPFALWFYQFLLLLSFDPLTLVILKVLVTAAVSAWALKNICKVLLLDWKWCFIFLFASPFAWHYARVLWDNVLLFPLSLCLLAFVCRFIQEEKSSFKNAFGAGICGCFMLLLHPMSLPEVALFPFVLFVDILVRKNAERKKIRGYLYVFFAGIVAAVPALYFYLPQFIRKIQNNAAAFSGNSGNMEGVSFGSGLACMENLSGFGYDRWFIPELTNGFSGKIYFIAGLVLMVILTVLLLAGIIITIKKILKKEITAEVMLGSFCFCILIAKIIMDNALQLKNYPHYQMPFAPVAGLLVLLGAKYILRNGRGLMAIKASSCAMVILTVFFFLTIYFHDGTKSFVYGPTLGNQFEMVKNVEKMIRLKVINKFQHGVGNYRAFPRALEVLFALHAHTYKPAESVPPGLKYNVILRYVSPEPGSGLLGLDIQQTAGAEFDIRKKLEE